MAKALADAVGATKRQVQFWSDHEVLEFLPGSGGSRGNQRLYPRTELPFAAMACYLAASGIRIGAIKMAMFMIRGALNNPEWPHRRHLRGEGDSYILVRTQPAAGGGYEQSFQWVLEEALVKSMESGFATTVINVKRVMTPHVE